MDWTVDNDSSGRAVVFRRGRTSIGKLLLCRPNPCMEDGLSATDVAILMASAPALLRELKRLLALWEEAVGYEKDYMPLADSVRDVIAKAERRSV